MKAALLATALWAAWCAGGGAQPASGEAPAGERAGAAASVTAAEEPGAFESFARELGDDANHLFRSRSMGALWVGIAAAGMLAHTRGDEEARAWYQAEARSAGTDRAAELLKPLGEHLYALPLYAGVSFLGACGGGDGLCGTLGAWGQRSVRTMLVGAPLVCGLQWTLGSSRPVEERGSEWRPFKDDNGASRHAFVGAIPFLSAAGMARNRALRSALVLGSMAGGLSRLNDDEHYLSQVWMGWWCAALAACAVDATENAAADVALVPAAGPGFSGAALAFSF
ncbi:MAG: hypothetical protein FJ225_09370 [Lentisphaerae bacterium]|nr:hypothetical protein [Lentisphaerota bacterium]